MRNYKVDAVRGIQEWCWRMTQLNNYMLLIPSDALAKRGATKEQYTEVEIRKILDIALPEAYRKKLLVSIGIHMNKRSRKQSTLFYDSNPKSRLKQPRQKAILS